MKKTSFLVFAVLFAAGLAPAAAEPGRDEARDPRAEDAALYRDRFYGQDPFSPSFERSGEPAEPSVNMSEEFSMSSGSRTNIDSFLGDFENPYAPLESTYEGSRSEMRQEGKRLRDQ